MNCEKRVEVRMNRLLGNVCLDYLICVIVSSEAYYELVCLHLQTDYDMVEYLNDLRESCLEAYTGIVQGLKGEAGQISGNLLLTLYTG